MLSFAYTTRHIIAPVTDTMSVTSTVSAISAGPTLSSSAVESSLVKDLEASADSQPVGAQLIDSLPVGSLSAGSLTKEATDAVATGSVSPSSGRVSEEPSRLAVPILIYHSIGDNDSEMQELFVSIEDFTAQVDYLQRTGYTCISFGQLWDHWQNDTILPEKPVILTFDDGYRSFYHRAYPLLLERGITATLFLVSEHFDLPRGMTRGMARDVASQGFEIGSHSRYHRNLNQVSLFEAKQEVLYSKEDLEKMLDKPVRIFAYPEGQHSAELCEVIRDAGYRFAVTATEGLAHPEDDYYQLKRILIGRSDGLEGFIYKLTGSRP